jgi:hypothetical protein
MRTSNPRPQSRPHPHPHPHLPSPSPTRTRCLHKDIGRIAQCLDPHMLGVFVKTVLRVVSYLDVTREVGLASIRATILTTRLTLLDSLDSDSLDPSIR